MIGERQFKFAIEALGNLLYPNICAGCGTDLSGKEVVCSACCASLPVTNFHMHANNPIEKIFWGRVPLLTAFSYLYFNKHSIVRQLLHQLKYQSNPEVGYFFGRKMGQAMLQSNRFIDLDALVPLPLHEVKLRSRGYNQAELVAKGMAEILNIPILSSIVSRPSQNVTQTHKNRTERWQNTSGKFKVNQQMNLERKHILLIDDVVTTGATLEACATEILKLKASISIATVAYTSL